MKPQLSQKLEQDIIYDCKKIIENYDEIDYNIIVHNIEVFLSAMFTFNIKSVDLIETLKKLIEMAIDKDGLNIPSLSIKIFNESEIDMEPNRMEPNRMEPNTSFYKEFDYAVGIYGTITLFVYSGVFITTLLSIAIGYL
jgi:hypothetical protein